MVECVRAVRGTAAGAAGMFSNYMQLCPHLNKMSFYLLACFVHKLCTLTLCVANGTVPTLVWNANLIQVAVALVITKCAVTTALLCCASATGMLTESQTFKKIK